MASEPFNLTQTLPVQRAFVYFPALEHASQPRLAWLWISSCVRWRYVHSEDEKTPCSRTCFRRQWSLSLEGQPFGSDWKEVEETVRTCDTAHGPAIVLSGTVCGPRHRTCLLNVAFVIEEDLARSHCLEALRIRVSPWDLLYRQLSNEFLNPLRLHISHGKPCQQGSHDALVKKSEDKKHCSLEKDEPDATVNGEKETLANVGTGQQKPKYNDEQYRTSLIRSMLLAVSQLKDTIALVSDGRKNTAVIRHFRRKVDYLHDSLVTSLFHVIDECKCVDDTACRDFFEVQDEILLSLKRIESIIMVKRFWQFWNRMPWKEIEFMVDRLQEIVHALDQSCEMPLQYSCEGVLAEEQIGYSNVADSLMHLAERELERDSEDAGRALRECTVANRYENGNMTIGYSDILFELGGVQNLEGATDEAIESFRECLRIRRSIFGINDAHGDVASAIFALAEVLKSTEQLNEAVELFREGLSMHRMFHEKEPNDVEFSNVLFKVATVLEENGSHPEASALLDECLKLKRKMRATPADNLEVAIILFVSARILEKMTSLDRNYLVHAEIRYRESLEIEYQVYGHGDQMEIAQTLYALGCVLDKMSKIEEAATMLADCLSMRQRLYGVGVDTPNISHVLYALGSVHEKMQKLNEAMTFYNNCLEMEKRIYGGVSLDLASSLFACGRIMMKKDCLDEAQRFFQECLVMLTRYHGDRDDVESARTMAALAGVLTAQGNLDEAEVLFRKCLNMNRRITGEDQDDADIAYVLQKLAELLVRRCEHEKAELLFRESFSMKDRLYGESWDRSVVWLSLYDLALSILHHDGNDSERLFRESLDLLQRIHGKSTCQSNVAAVKLGLARSLFSKGCVDEAGMLFKESLDLYQKFHGQNDDISFAHALDWNGLHAASKGLHEEADRLYTRSLEMHRRLKGKDCNNAEIVHILAELGKVALERGMLQRSTNFHMECLAMAQTLGDESRTGNALYELATLAWEVGDVSKSESLYRKSLEVFRKLHGEQDHGDVAVALIGLATVVQTKGPRSLLDAENLFRQGLEMKGRLKNDCSYASLAFYDMALTALDFLLLNDAERLFRESWNHDRRIYGENADNSNIANTLEGLAKSLMEKGDLIQSDALFTQSFEMSQRLNKNDKGNELFWKARLAFERGDLDGADSIFGESLEAFRRQLKLKDDSEIAITIHWRARVQLERRNFDAARALFLESTFMYRRMHLSEPDHSDLSFALYWESRAAFECGLLDVAEATMLASLEMDRKIHGQDVDHTDITSTLYRLAEIELAKNDLEAACLHSSEALAMARRLFGDDTDQLFIANAARVSGRVALAKNLFEEAEAFFTQCLNMRQRVHGEFILPSTAESVFWLAELARKRGAIPDAVDGLRRCIGMYHRVYECNESHPRIRELENKLSQLIQTSETKPVEEDAIS